MATSTAEPAGSDAGLVVRPGSYGGALIQVEPGGAEFIPLSERHGRPSHLLWTWASPNLEFATVFVGVLGVAAFGLGFWTAVGAIVLGTALGSISHGLLSARGPSHGVPQMILSRVAFGFPGNALPAGVNALTAGIGWFAVNSVSGALALNTLTGIPKALSLVLVVAAQLVVAFFGHNLVHAFERWVLPFLAVAFLLATVYTFAHAHVGMSGGGGGVGGFLLLTGAAFGYAAGWNPYASDYTRYLPAGVSRVRVALAAGGGVFLSCVLLEAVGAASATIAAPAGASPTGAFTGHLPTFVADVTLLAIALGAVSANALNIYSGALSFLSIGLRLPLALRRAIVAGVFGAIGFVLALTALDDAGSKYESFLLIIAYWIGPWLGVFLTDQALRRGRPVDHLLFNPGYRNWAGPVAMLAGMGLSIWLFSNQTRYVGVVPSHVPEVGDITAAVGFLVAAAVYAASHLLARRRPA